LTARLRAPSFLGALLLGLLLFLPATTALSLQSSTLGALSFDASMTADSAEQDGLQVSLVYPHESLTNFDNASQVCNLISQELGLGPLIPLEDNSRSPGEVSQGRVYSIFDNSTEVIPGIERACSHWWGRSEDGSCIGALFQPDGKLVEVKGWLASEAWMTGPSVNHTMVGRQFSELLGIEAMLPMSDEPEYTFRYDINETLVENITTVRFWGPLAGREMTNVNRLVAVFSESRLMAFQLFCFFESNGLPSVDEEQALVSAVGVAAAYSGYAHPSVSGEVSWTWLDLTNSSMVHTAALCVTDELDGSLPPLVMLIHVDAETGEVVGTDFYTPPEEQKRLSPVDYLRILISSLNEITSLIPLWAMIAAVLMVIGLAIIVGVPIEIISVPLFTFFILLYTHLSKERALEHGRRELILDFITRHPGIHYSELRRSLGMANGSLLYHLSVLARSGCIKSRRAGNILRYYTSETDEAPREDSILTDVQKSIVSFVVSKGSCSKSEIKNFLGTSYQTTHYNLKKLVERGALESFRVKGSVHYRLTEPSMPVPTGAMEPPEKYSFSK